MPRETMIERFLKYVKVDTQSKYEQPQTPSTPGQRELAKIVYDDLKAAGVSDLEMTDECFIYATVKGTSKRKVPVLGLLAHLDTATETPGKDVKARFIKNYQGETIAFPANPDLKLTTESTPKLKNYIGHTLITADGTTLLGGDDKAGLSILVELAHHYKDHPEEEHGDIRIAIIPDEEIGVGAEKLDLKKFGADVAYTLDGGELGEIDVESFNGYKGKMEITGYAAFPGYGKGTYINAIQVFAKFAAAMENERWPQNCDKRQPIWWLDKLEGGVGRLSVDVYLRDFDLDGISKQMKLLDGIKEKVLKDFPGAKITYDIKEQYKNYRYELNKDPRILEYAEEAMKRIGITPKRNFVRGGNDSCHLCFSGLLSTNLFIGMENMHSFGEWISVSAIEASLKTVISLVKVWLDKS